MQIIDKSSGSDPFGRYYTNLWASHRLISELANHQPRCIIDLGAGAGSLSSAARQKWQDADIITVDIDSTIRQPLDSFHSPACGARHSHFSFDALRVDLPELIRKNCDGADMALCNPPFLKLKWSPSFSEILEDAGLSDCYGNHSDASAEVLFLAQNLRIIRDGGSIGIIVPDSIISGKKHSLLRKRLMENHKVSSIIKLPRNVFIGTDAQAFIITMEKNGTPSLSIDLQKISLERDIAQLSCSVISATQNADIDFNMRLPPKNTAGSRELGGLVVSLERGKISSIQRHAIANSFHTTDFPGLNQTSIAFPESTVFPDKTADRNVFAKSGDIVIARVGRNFERKICMITSGCAVVTDCIYVLRPQDKYRNQIFYQLCSPIGRAWLADVAHGVAAKQLPKENLLKFPIYLDENK